MDDIQPGTRGLNLFVAVSLLIHALLSFVLWKLPTVPTKRAPRDIPVFLVDEEAPRHAGPAPSTKAERIRSLPERTDRSRRRASRPPETTTTTKQQVSGPPVSDIPDLVPTPKDEELGNVRPEGRRSVPAETNSLDTTADEAISNLDEGSKGNDRAASLNKNRSKIALYDPGVVAGVVGPEIPYSDVPEVTLDTAEFKRLSYMEKLRERIESIWIYPPSALRKGVTGDLFIRFVILDDGSLGDIRLVRTSGYPELDQAALTAVREAAPFLPLPKKWEVDKLAIKGHFYYSMSGYYIR